MTGEASAFLGPRPSPIGAWLLTGRPKTLSASVVPVTVGSALAWSVGSASWAVFFACLVGAVAIQVGTNFANDVFDFKKGADTQARVGPARAVAAGWLSSHDVLKGMVFAFLVAALAGAYLVHLRGWPMVLVGVLSVLSGVLYTAGPYPLAYLGLGDVFVFVFFGVVAVVGTAFAHTGDLFFGALLCSLPVGALSTAILVVNNMRDRHTDAAANKRTLAVRFGRRFTLIEDAVLLMMAYLSLPLLVWAVDGVSGWVLLPLATLPMAVRQFRDVSRLEGASLNQTLAQTGGLHLAFGLLLSVGLVL